MLTKAQKSERDECAARLREWLKPGDTVYTILRHRARSGMFRRISLTAPDPKDAGRMMYLDGNAAHALGLKLSDKCEGLPASGCGMDMGFALVYELSRVLWPAGFGCVGDTCPSNDHSNGDRSRIVGDKHWHKDGGYALRHRWL